MFYLLLQTYQKKGKNRHERVRDPGFIISASVINSNLKREPDKASGTDNFSKPPEKSTAVTSNDEPLIKESSSVVLQSAVPINIPANLPINVPVDIPVEIPTNTPVYIPVTVPTNKTIIVPTKRPVNVPTNTPVTVPINVPENNVPIGDTSCSTVQTPEPTNLSAPIYVTIGGRRYMAQEIGPSVENVVSPGKPAPNLRVAPTSKTTSPNKMITTIPVSSSVSEAVPQNQSSINDAVKETPEVFPGYCRKVKPTITKRPKAQHTPTIKRQRKVNYPEKATQPNNAHDIDKLYHAIDNVLKLRKQITSEKITEQDDMFFDNFNVPLSFSKPEISSVESSATKTVSSITESSTAEASTSKILKVEKAEKLDPTLMKVPPGEPSFANLETSIDAPAESPRKSSPKAHDDSTEQGINNEMDNGGKSVTENIVASTSLLGHIEGTPRKKQNSYVYLNPDGTVSVASEGESSDEDDPVIYIEPEPMQKDTSLSDNPNSIGPRSLKQVFPHGISKNIPVNPVVPSPIREQSYIDLSEGYLAPEGITIAHPDPSTETDNAEDNTTEIIMNVTFDADDGQIT